MKLFEIERELKSAREEYHKAVESGVDRSALGELNDKIKELMTQLSSSIAEGASAACPSDTYKGVAPHGLKRRAGLYEIGCLDVPGLRATGESPEEAVANFNDLVAGSVSQGE